MTLLRAEELNVYDVLLHDLIVIPQAELPSVEARWASVPRAGVS